MEFIRLAISQPFLKIETSGLDKKFYKNMCRTFRYFWVIKCISGHVTGHKLFFKKKSANIFETVPVTHTVHR